MSTLAETFAAPPSSSIPSIRAAGIAVGLERIAQLMRAALRAARQRLDLAQAPDRLAYLDERMLRDIGVDPSSVPERQHGKRLPLLMAALSQ